MTCVLCASFCLLQYDWLSTVWNGNMLHDRDEHSDVATSWPQGYVGRPFRNMFVFVVPFQTCLIESNLVLLKGDERGMMMMMMMRMLMLILVVVFLNDACFAKKTMVNSMATIYTTITIFGWNVPMLPSLLFSTRWGWKRISDIFACGSVDLRLRKGPLLKRTKWPLKNGCLGRHQVSTKTYKHLI